MRNMHLYEALKGLCEESLPILKIKLKKSGELPFNFNDKPELSVSAGGLQYYDLQKDAYGILQKNDQYIKVLDVYNSAIQALNHDEMVKKHLMYLLEQLIIKLVLTLNIICIHFSTIFYINKKVLIFKLLYLIVFTENLRITFTKILLNINISLCLLDLKWKLKGLNSNLISQ